MTEIPLSHPEFHEREAVGQQREAIRAFVRERVSDEPLPETEAERAIEEFGLEPGGYDVFADKESVFGGGFKKFVPKSDPSKALEGMTYGNVGGPHDNLDHSLHNVLLEPNGDLTGKITTENNNGTKITNLAWSALSTDPEASGAYERHVRAMHDRARAMVEKKKSPSVEVNPTIDHEVATQQPRKYGFGLLRLLLRRSK